MDGPAGPEPTTAPEAPVPSDPVVVRPRAVATVAVIGTPILVVGALLATTGASPVARAGLLVMVAAIGAVLVVPTVRFRLEVHPDGALRKRSWRTTEVDLTRLSCIHARRDHPWFTYQQAVVGLEDRDGRVIEVPLTPVSFLGGDHWVALAPWIERSGLPLSGACRWSDRALTCTPSWTCRRPTGSAYEAAVSSAHEGHVHVPSVVGQAYDERSFGWLLAAGFALLLIPAARSGMVPGPQIGVWTALFLVAAAMVFGAVFGGPATSQLELGADGALVRQRRAAVLTGRPAPGRSRAARARSSGSSRSDGWRPAARGAPLPEAPGGRRRWR
jgi:hypothetical protein